MYFDQRKGSASTADFGPESLAATVRAACDIARYTSRDECSGLADADRMATLIPDLDLYHPWGLDAELAIAVATECEAAGLVFVPLFDNCEVVTLSCYVGMRVYSITLGFLGCFCSSYHSFSCAVFGKKGVEMQSDYW